jgi:hypothetical protein
MMESEVPGGPHFNGPEYVPALDHDRLTGQIQRVYDCMRDGRWRTLDEIARETGDPQASISAQIRHLRKPRFGSFVTPKRRRGDPSDGLFEYRLLPPEEEDEVAPPVRRRSNGRRPPLPSPQELSHALSALRSLQKSFPLFFNAGLHALVSWLERVVEGERSE